MKRFVILFLLLLVAYPAASAGDEASVPPGCELIGIVHFDGKTRKVAGHAKRDIDALLPQLKKLGKGRLVIIEGRAAPGNNRDRYISNSLYVAKEVKLYLSGKRDLQLDLYIGVMDDKIPYRDRNVARIVLYPYEVSEVVNGSL